MDLSKPQIISRKNIKPSSPTPENLKYYNLSFIDQSLTQKYQNITLFYSNTNGSSNISIPLLEKSLSNLLTYYYPFAGTLKDNLLIECNDKGALFIESSIESSMSEILEQPLYNVESTLFPCVLPWTDPDELVVIQITNFGCGGMSLSVFITQKLADPRLHTKFLLDWAALARESTTPCLQLNGASLFPPNDDPLTEEYVEVRSSKFTSAVTVSRMFTFDASNVKRLKKIISDETDGVTNPTRTEALMAFMNVCIGRYQSFPFIIYLPIGFRPLVNPNLNHLVGNVMTFIFIYVMDKDDLKLSTLATKIQEEIEKKYKKFEGMNENEIFAEILEDKENFPMNLDMRGTTSFSLQPSYGADYGWGRPERVKCGAIPTANYIVLMDNLEEGGVDLIVTLDETVMHKLQHDEEFLEFTHFDSSC